MHGAFVFVDRLDQLGAAVDVEMVGRLVEDQELRRRRRSPGPSAGAPSRRPTGCATLVSARVAGKADLRGAGADLRLGRAAHPLARRGCRACRRTIELVDLVLGEKADLELVGARISAGHRREAPAEQLGEGRLAVAVGAEQADAVVVGERAGLSLDRTARSP